MIKAYASLHGLFAVYPRDSTAFSSEVLVKLNIATPIQWSVCASDVLQNNASGAV